MKMNTPGIKNEAKKVQLKRRLKFGGLSVALSLAVIALVIAANVIFSYVISSNRLYADLTDARLFTLSDEAKEYLTQLKAPITIKFAVPEDTVKSDYQLFMVNLAATQFSKASKEEDKNDEIPDITVQYYDTYRNPAQFEKYKEYTTSAWKSTNVVIETTYESEEGEKAALPLVRTIDAFFTKDSNSGTITKFNGERTFLLAFLTLAGIERPVVVFTTGHAEPIGDSPDDPNNRYSDFTNMLTELGFEVKYQNLSKEDLDENCRLLIILDPQSDFISKNLTSFDEVSEIDKISRFVSDHGSLMTFLGPTGIEYKELGQYLEERGMNVETRYTVEDPENSLYTSELGSFFANYTTEDDGGLIQAFKGRRTYFLNAAPLKIRFNEKNETEATKVSTLFRSSSSAKAYASETDVITPSDLGNANGFDLFAMSKQLNYNKNESYYSYVFVCGCPDMLKYCGTDMFANNGVMRNLASKTSLQKIPPEGITGKSLENYGLSSITKDAATAWLVVLAVVMPAVTFGVGIVVVILRKRR